MTWHRVFGQTDQPPDAPAVARTIVEIVPRAAVEWELGEQGDQGWLSCTIRLPGVEEPLRLSRFLRDEEGIRAELQAWAAWVETTDSPHAQRLMQQLMTARQVFTVRPPEGREVDESILQICLSLCRFLAHATEGIYQIDERGLFDAAGTPLVREE